MPHDSQRSVQFSRLHSEAASDGWGEKTQPQPQPPLRLLGKQSLPLRAVVTTSSSNISTSDEIEKVGVLLLNLGGPETLDDVQPFLFNLFADPVFLYLFIYNNFVLFESNNANTSSSCSVYGQDIIRLPPLFQFLQKPLAQFISVARAPKSKEGYASIGGGSPLRRITDSQVFFLFSPTFFLFSLFREVVSSSIDCSQF